MTKILVTGGAGFVGSHLCERLASAGHEVISLDNYYTGSIENHVNGVSYIEGDTRDILELIKFPVDYVYHLGEYSRVEQSFEDIETMWDFNTNGTFEVLQYVRKFHPRLIYAGSSTKFADNVDDYVQSPYAWSKARNTDLVVNYGKWFGIDYAITYFYNVYGKREIKDGKYATLIAKYKTLIKNGEPLPVVLPGTQIRNFTHVDDIVDGLILVGAYGKGDEYGIGNSNSYSIETVAKMFGGELEYLDPRRGNRMSAPVLTDKIKNLGWRQKRELPDYINKLKENGWCDE